MSEFGKRLRRARQNKGMLQEDLAQAMGLTQASISQFEKGQRTPTPANIRKLAQILGVKEEDLAGKDKGNFERALLMRNMRDLSPGSLSRINEYVELIKESERARRRRKR